MKNNMKNQVGEKIGHWTILGLDEEKSLEKHRTYWICKCDCENPLIQSVRQDALKLTSCKNCCGAKKLDDLTGKKFGHWTVIGRGIGPTEGHTYWLCECNCKDKTRRNVDAYKLKNGVSTSCGCSTESKGEKIIEYILRANNIKFEREKIFLTCKLNKNGIARFDFWVDDKYIIEYDGEQHFVLRDSGWNSPEKLEQTKQRDAIKNQWCKDNNIPLIRIPYTHLEDLCLEDLLLETSQYIIK